MYVNELYISPNYIITDYLDLNLSLSSTEEDWHTAINIFSNRIEGRFLLLIQDLSDKISDNFRQVDYCFSAMALCCLLIETLHQFYNGLDVTVFRGHRDAFVCFASRKCLVLQPKVPSPLASIAVI